MAVQEKQETTENKQATEVQLAKKSGDLANSIIKTLDLPTSIADAVDKEHERAESESNSESSDDNSSEVQAEEVSSEGNEELPSEQDDSDKRQDSVQKRIDELTREKRQLEARLKKLESNSTPSEPSDPDLEKLQKMSVEELKETRKKILRAQRTADENTLDSLFELEEKVNRTIENAPKRFQSNQLERFNEAVASTTDLTDKEMEVVFGHAKNIFSRTPSFQKSVDGQSEAWNLAVEHYKEMNKLTVGKSKVNELERKVNDLKKKTSLDTAVQKGNSKISEESKLFNRAKNGTSSDKEAFLKKRLDTDSMIPEEYRR